MITTMITSTTAIGAIHLYLLPSVQGPGTNESPIRQRRKIGITYAMYSPITPIDTTAVKATVTPSLLPFSAGSVIRNATNATAMTALNGMRRWLTLLQVRQPGTAPSRLNAYIIRDALVMQLMPQKNCPITQMIRMNSTQPVLIEFSKTAKTVPPPSLTFAGSCAANVIASSTIQPMIAE